MKSHALPVVHSVAGRAPHRAARSVLGRGLGGPHLLATGSLLTGLILAVSGCSDDQGTGILPPTQGTVGQLVGPGVGSGSPDPSASGSSATPPGTGVSVIVPEQMGDTGGIVDEGDTEAPPQDAVCQSGSTPTSLQGVVLAFAFDVSSSMGSGTLPYNDRTLKWEPVVAATKAFFVDPSSTGVSAMLTFFPNDSGGGGGGGMFGGGGDTPLCDPDEYATPDVALTELPSEAFGTAIDDITPADDDGWRSGTPTMAVLQGTIQNVQELQANDPANKYVIVLVTDGEPSSCSADDNDIANVAAAAGEVSDTIPTYVIGVQNPVTEEEPNPPDAVGNLNIVAEQGGTEAAFIINTEDPAQTAADFRAVIESIRTNSFSCNLPIPAPPAGKTFDPTKVNVTYSNMIGLTEFVYDETCTERFAWHYDDPANPTVIQMCDQVCLDIRADYKNEGMLDVEFGCATRISMAH
jgi:hypothetical protein